VPRQIGGRGRSQIPKIVRKNHQKDARLFYKSGGSVIELKETGEREGKGKKLLPEKEVRESWGNRGLVKSSEGGKTRVLFLKGTEAGEANRV